jgi:hypothetical protein
MTPALADAKDIRQTNFNPLVSRNVNTCYTSHIISSINPGAAYDLDFHKSHAPHLSV